jgi:hypothetical protein
MIPFIPLAGRRARAAFSDGWHRAAIPSGLTPP